LPDWTRIDLGLRQALENPFAAGKPLTLRLNVENVAGSHYWSTGGDYLIISAPRTVRLSVTVDF